MTIRISAFFALFFVSIVALGQQHTVKVMAIFPVDDGETPPERTLFIAAQQLQMDMVFANSGITNVNVEFTNIAVAIPFSRASAPFTATAHNIWMKNENNTPGSLLGGFRNTAGADLVVFYVPNFVPNRAGQCGEAGYEPGNIVPYTIEIDNEDEFAFATIRTTCSSLTTVHEIGHLLYAEHQADLFATPVDSNNDYGAPRSYNHGIAEGDDDGDEASIMYEIPVLSDAERVPWYSGELSWLTDNGAKVRDLIDDDSGKIVAAYRNPPPPPTYKSCTRIFQGCITGRPHFLVYAKSNDAPIDSMDWERSGNGSSWTTAYPAQACDVFVGKHRFTWIGTSGYAEFLRGVINTYYGTSGYCSIFMSVSCGGGMPQFAGPSPDAESIVTGGIGFGDDSPKPGYGPNGEIIMPGTVFEGEVTEDGVPAESKEKGKGNGNNAGTMSPLMQALQAAQEKSAN